MELLAPAGCLETAAAAFQYGADAVYCGLKQFSARADAVNFADEELEVLLGMAHNDQTRPRKVYITLNTLLRQDELPELLRTLEMLDAARPDGIIVQDLGVARLAAKHFPALPLHASTQMAIHSLDGLRACRAMGFKRVIAARELTLNELVMMAPEPGIELEVFIHGALCYAYSGLCLLSSVLRDASGNRGECTYICRNSWDITADGRTQARSCPVMSMKDLAQSDAIGALSRAGVASVKIEGRKKSPLYVAAVTNYYRKLMDNSFRQGEREECEQDIKSIFSRPWTQFFLPGTRRFGITDTAVTGPRGCPAGRVVAFTPAGKGRPAMLRIVTQNIILERHDGLQVELPGRTRPYGFPVDAIVAFRQGGGGRRENVFTATPGSTVEIPLPEDAPEMPVGLPIFCTSSQQTQRRYAWPSIRPALVRQRKPADFKIRLTPEVISGTASLADGDVSVSAELTTGDTPLTAARKSPELNAQSIRDCLAKLGDTPYQAREITIDNTQELFAPASLLNELRRQLTTQLSDAELEAHSQKLLRLESQLEQDNAPNDNADAQLQWTVKIDRTYALNMFSDAELASLHEVIFDVSRSRPDDELREMLDTLAEKVGKGRLRIALPTILRDADAGGAGRPREWRQFVSELAGCGYRNWQVSGLGGLELLKSQEITTQNASITADWQLYCTNIQAAKQLLELGLQRVTLSPDDKSDNICALAAKLGDMADTIVFQDTPLAISAVCANASLLGVCPGHHQCTFKEFELTNRNGETLVAVNNHCQSVYVRKAPLDRSADVPQLSRCGAKHLRADFIWRDWSPAMVRNTARRLGIIS